MEYHATVKKDERLQQGLTNMEWCSSYVVKWKKKIKLQAYSLIPYLNRRKNCMNLQLLLGLQVGQGEQGSSILYFIY